MVSFSSVQELIDEANKENTTISEIALRQTAKDMEISKEEVYNKMLENLNVMRDSINSGLDKDIKSPSGLSGGMAISIKENLNTEKSIAGDFLGEIIYNAISVSEVNACMGKIVAAPTAGSSGIVPSCLISLANHKDISEEKLVMGLLNASAIGMVVAKNASISGAKGGCQAECGTSAAMAASAMVEIMGGTPEECGHSIAQAIKSLMGLVCDPVAGLVEEPCIIRNASSAAIAVTSAEISLAGVKSIIPVDEVILAMDAVGRGLPESLRETAQGGIAICETAKKISKRISPN